MSAIQAVGISVGSAQKTIAVGLGEVKRQSLSALAPIFLRKSLPSSSVPHFNECQKPLWSVEERRPVDTAPTLTRYLDEHSEESLLHRMGSKDILARSLFAPHLQLFSPGQLPLPNPLVADSKAAMTDSVDQSPIQIDTPQTLSQTPAILVEASCGADTPLDTEERHPEPSQQLMQLRRRLRKQKLQMLESGARHCQASAMKAWATQALLARQRVKHQQKLSKLKAEAQEEVADVRAAKVDIEAEFRERLRRERIKSWNAASQHAQALALRAWATQALLGKQRSVHRQRMASLRASKQAQEPSQQAQERSENIDLDVRAAPTQVQSQASDYAEARRYPMDFLLQHREIQRLTGSVLNPPPGLDSPEADARLRRLRLPPGLEVAAAPGLMHAPPGLKFPGNAAAPNRSPRASL